MSTDGSALGYSELLRLANSNGLQELDSTIVQIPTEANGGHGIVLATARTPKALFRAIGEAWRDTLSPDLRGQTLTVAEHRAKTRALCEAVGMPQSLGTQHNAQGDPTSRAADRPTTAPSRPSSLPGAGAASASDHYSSDRPSSSLRVAPSSPGQETVPSQPEVSQSQPMPRQPTVAELMARTTAPSPAPALSSRKVPDPLPVEQAVEEDHPIQTAPTRAETRTGPTIPRAEGLGPDVLQRLLQMTIRKAGLEGADISEDEALRKLDSFFQRAFGHPLADGTRMEGQRVLQRLAADLSKLSAEQEGNAAYAAG